MIKTYVVASPRRSNLGLLRVPVQINGRVLYINAMEYQVYERVSYILRTRLRHPSILTYDIPFYNPTKVNFLVAVPLQHQPFWVHFRRVANPFAANATTTYNGPRLRYGGCSHFHHRHRALAARTSHYVPRGRK